MWPKIAIGQDHNANEISWTEPVNLPASVSGKAHLGVAGAFAGWHNGVLMIAGGANFPYAKPWEGGKKVYHNDIFVLKKSGDSLQWIDSAAGRHLKQKIAYGASVSVPQGVVCLGGEDESGAMQTVFLMQWDDVRREVAFKPLPDLPVPLSNAGAAAIGNVVYIAGGEGNGKPSNGFFALDLSAPEPVWRTLPALPVALSHSVVVAQGNGKNPCVYVMGGRSARATRISDLHGSNYCYDPSKRKWETRAPIGDGTVVTNLSAGTGFAIGASYIVLVGGDKGNVFHQIETLNTRIAAAGITEGEKLQAEKRALLNGHEGFSRDIYLYNTITDVWTRTGEVPGKGQVTTTAVKVGNEIFVPSGEVRPGVRTPAVTRGTIRNQASFSWIDTAVLFICFLLMTAGRFLFTGHTNNTDDYFKGGERIPQWAAGISIFGAKLSAITFMGIPAKTYATDWTYFFLLMTIIMVMPMVARYFIPFYRRLHVTSAYEYLGKRFNDGCRMFASMLYVLLQLGRMGIVVLLPSIALTLVTGIDVSLCIIIIGAISIFFTVKGGIEAVIWVEVVQVLILAAGALFCLFYLPFQIDDWQGGFEAAQHAGKLKVFDFRFDFTEPTFWVVVIGGLAISLLTYGTDQTTVQRYLTTKTESESVKSLKLGAWLTLPSTLVFFSIGTLLFLFFREQPQNVNMALDNVDNIFPWYIVSQLPAGLSGLLIAGIFAAAMSSTEASMNSTATLLTTDFYQKFKRGVTPKQTLLFARVATLLLGVFVTCIALYMAHKGVSSLWDKFNIILGLFTGCIGGAFVLGIFTRKASGNGVIAGMPISCVTQVLIQQYTDIHLLMYAFTGLVSCMVFGYILSLLMPDSRDLSGLTVHG